MPTLQTIFLILVKILCYTFIVQLGKDTIFLSLLFKLLIHYRSMFLEYLEYFAPDFSLHPSISYARAENLNTRQVELPLNYNS